VAGAGKQSQSIRGTLAEPIQRPELSRLFRNHRSGKRALMQARESEQEHLTCHCKNRQKKRGGKTNWPAGSGSVDVDERKPAQGKARETIAERRKGGVVWLEARRESERALEARITRSCFNRSWVDISEGGGGNKTVIKLPGSLGGKSKSSRLGKN